MTSGVETPALNELILQLCNTVLQQLLTSRLWLLPLELTSLTHLLLQFVYD